MTRGRIGPGVGGVWLAASLLVLAALPAHAACTATPAPQVNWQECNFTDRQLVHATLTGANLRDASFFTSDLSDADLSGIDGRRLKIIDSKLGRARFDGARLTEADFTRSDLRGASFRNANMLRSHLSDANLRGADFTGARLDGAEFLHADFSNATWTDGTTHCAEGSIGQCNPASGEEHRPPRVTRN